MTYRLSYPRQLVELSKIINRSVDSSIVPVDRQKIYHASETMLGSHTAREEVKKKRTT
jgi:hypothetical protein